MWGVLTSSHNKKAVLEEQKETEREELDIGGGGSNKRSLDQDAFSTFVSGNETPSLHMQQCKCNSALWGVAVDH